MPSASATSAFRCSCIRATTRSPGSFRWTAPASGRGPARRAARRPMSRATPARHGSAWTPACRRPGLVDGQAAGDDRRRAGPGRSVSGHHLRRAVDEPRRGCALGPASHGTCPNLCVEVAELRSAGWNRPRRRPAQSQSDAGPDPHLAAVVYQGIASRRPRRDAGRGSVGSRSPFPRLRFRMVDEQDRMRPHMRVFVGGRQFTTWRKHWRPLTTSISSRP